MLHLTKKIISPATVRAASGAAQSGSKNVWLPGEVRTRQLRESFELESLELVKTVNVISQSFPIFAVIGGGCTLVAAILARNSFGSKVDTWWTKQNRGKGIAIWYESKYPGIEQTVAKPGE